MFKEFIKNIITVTRRFSEFLEEVYEVTYTEVSKQLTEEVNKRRKENKDEFVDKVSKIIKRQCYKETHELMEDNIARSFAKRFFRIAKLKGDLDEFNRLDPKGDDDE